MSFPDQTQRHEVAGVLLENFTPRRELGRRVIESATRIRARQTEQERLRYVAYHDELTGLGNSRAFHEEFESAVGSANHSGERVALVLVDLDNLKWVNDTLGHLKGNDYVKAAAEALQASVREEDRVFRIGGDEFAILLYGYAPASEARNSSGVTAGKTISKLRAAVVSKSKAKGLATKYLGASIGFGYAKDHERAEDLFVRADGKLYENKNRRKAARAGMGFVTEDDRNPEA